MVYFGSQFRVQSIMAGKSRVEELGAAGHVVPVVRKQRGWMHVLE